MGKKISTLKIFVYQTLSFNEPSISQCDFLTFCWPISPFTRCILILLFLVTAPVKAASSSTKKIYVRGKATRKLHKRLDLHTGTL